MGREDELGGRVIRGGDGGLSEHETGPAPVPILGISEGAAVALQLCREAMRDQKDAIKMGRYFIEKERHEEH